LPISAARMMGAVAADHALDGQRGGGRGVVVLVNQIVARGGSQIPRRFEVTAPDIMVDAVLLENMAAGFAETGKGDHVGLFQIRGIHVRENAPFIAVLYRDAEKGVGDIAIADGDIAGDEQGNAAIAVEKGKALAAGAVYAIAPNRVPGERQGLHGVDADAVHDHIAYPEQAQGAVLIE